ncbi:MAG: cation:dicarboxylase symporter family transporter [Novosphingobium sp.]|nr:cation:dicarboxylase symporter family transporter [Novosphingobium sp.]MCP5401750.1 cation:dicarboxylase symporter family transporter [Novosphingobium sp.]
MTEQTGAGSLPEIRVPTALTFAGLAAGLALGIALKGTSALDPLLAVAEPLGALWLRALKMTILPLVVGLLFTGIIQTAAAARAGATARRALGLIVAVLAAGGVLAAFAMPLLLDIVPVPERAAQALSGGGADGPQDVPGVADFLASLLPANIVEASAADAMLPVVIFVALFALAACRLPEAPRRQLALFFEALAGAMMVVIGWVLMLAPVGVFALALGVAAQSGMAAIGALAHYIALVSSIGLLILIAAYFLAVLAARQRPGAFARAVLPAQAVAISTQSSLASLPAMLAACRKLGIRESNAEFVLPLAVAIFRATSPAMNLAVVIYAAELTGVPLSPGVLAAGVGVAVLLSLSTVSLPGTISFVATIGPIALAMGVPIEPLALLVAVEMLPDIMRTLANVTMNVAVTAAVDRNGGGG